MSADTAPRVGVQRDHRMLNLGEAVPISVGVFGEKRAPASEGKKHGQIQAEHQEWLDGQETTTRCSLCPDWKFTGPAADARTAAAAHRGDLHPELVGRRTFRKKGRIAPGREKSVPGEREALNAARAEREDADRLEKIERGRRQRGESAVPGTADDVDVELEEAASRLGPGAASSSPTTHDQEAPMATPTRGPRPSPTRDAILAHLAHGEASTQDLVDAVGSTRGSVEQTVSKLRKSGQVVRVRAGVYGLAGATPRVVKTVEGIPPQPEPEPAPPPAAEHAELVPIVDAAPPGRTATRLVQILSRLTSEDLEESADWYTAAIAQLEHERALITQAIEAKAA